MRFNDPEEVKKAIPDMVFGEILFFRGTIYEFDGKDLTYLSSIPPFYKSMKSDYEGFHDQLTNHKNSNRRLEFRMHFMGLWESGLMGRILM